MFGFYIDTSISLTLFYLERNVGIMVIQSVV